MLKVILEIAKSHDGDSYIHAPPRKVATMQVRASPCLRIMPSSFGRRPARFGVSQTTSNFEMVHSDGHVIFLGLQPMVSSGLLNGTKKKTKKTKLAGTGLL